MGHTLPAAAWILAAAVLAAGAPATPTLQPIDLRAEYRTAPVGLDVPRPLLSWKLATTTRGQAQTAWQVLTATTAESLARDRGDLWNSGKVAGDDFARLYAGKPPAAHQQCFWKVRVWDRDGRVSPWSKTARWTVGLTDPSGWKARWIAWTGTPKGSGPLPIFRKEIVLSAPVRRAEVYTSGLGFFELRINGRKVGDHVIDPGWTNYRKTAFYVAHDVTALLRPGPNGLGIMLGNGMYNVPGGRYAKFTGTFGPPKVILQLHLELADGTTADFGTDETWKAAAGPILFSCIFGGEDYDARSEQRGWDQPGFDDAAWTAAAVVDGPGGTLTSQLSPPVKIMRAFNSVHMTTPVPGIRVYDLGQNFSGWPRITARGRAGATVKITTGERLDSRGLVTQRSSGGPTTFSYTLRGGRPESWHPQFSYTGFRYLQVEGDAEILHAAGDFIHSSAPPAGQFSCSKPLFNRIHALVDAAVKSNLQSVLTDCPHREKLGWLEVAHLLGPSVLFNYDAATLYGKITRDIREAQTESGLVPDIAPEYVVFKRGFRDSPEWGSASVALPWLLYTWYGDRRVLEENYPAMQRYAAYLATRAENYILSHGLGDWYDIGPGEPGASKLTPAGVTATAMHYQNFTTLARVAGLLGRTADATRYAEAAGAVHQAFQARFFNPETRQYATGSQTANAIPLVLGMTPGEHRDAVLANLVNDVRTRGNRQTAGDVGHRYLLMALARGGRSDVVFDMTARTDSPSYGAQLAMGATSLTEAWDGNPAVSQNHCMLGHIEEWFYSALGGIEPDEAAPAFRRFTIAPQIVGDLTWVKVRYDSVRGPIVSEWRRTGDELDLNIEVPAGAVAAVRVPARSQADVTEGDRPAARAPMVRFIRHADGASIFEVPGGTYRFHSRITAAAAVRSPQK